MIRDDKMLRLRCIIWFFTDILGLGFVGVRKNLYLCTRICFSRNGTGMCSKGID